MTAIPTKPAAALCVLTAALVLAACSSDDGTPPASGGMAGSTANGGAGTTAGGTATAGMAAVNGGTNTGGSATSGGAGAGAGAGTNAGGSPSGGAGAGSSGAASGGAAGSGGAPPAGGSGGLAGAAGTGGAGGAAGGTATAQQKPRVVVLTDLGNEPDDAESLVRFLVYSNEFDVEALVATTSRHLRTNPQEATLRRQLDAYEMVHPNLLKHSPDYPTPAALRAVTGTGQTTFGMAAVGAGRSTPGSTLLIRAIDKPDPRPIWITVWGGANTLAQALFDLRATRTAAEMSAIVAKLRVYSISDQDDAGLRIRTDYPQLFYIVTPGTNYASATWSGISGDEHYSNGPGYQLNLVSNAWLNMNVRTGHGPLGALYPNWEYIMEGDTPAYLGLIDNGLGWSISPTYGGWGGRYAIGRPGSEPRDIWTNSSDTFPYPAGQMTTSAQATIWRWRPHFQFDFAARMDWCVADTFAKANHNPVAVLNGNRSKQVLTIPAKGGTTVTLSAEGTSDPDMNTVSTRWWIYREAGTLPAGATLSASEGATTQVRLPAVTAPGTLHVILETEDNGTPHLFAYRRAILDVTP